MSVRVYLEKNLTPDLVEEAMPLIKALHLEAMGHEIPGLNTDFLRDAVIADMLRVVVARDGQKLIGFLLAFQVTSLTGKKQINIHQVYVEPEYRARGRSPAVTMVELIQTLAVGAKASVSAVARGKLATDFYIAMGATPTELVLEFNNG